MIKQTRILLMITVMLIWFIQACTIMEPELRNGDVIEGEYEVGYVVSLQDNLIVIGSLLLANEKYTFTQQNEVDIPESIADRFFFAENVEGQYEVIYDFAYQPSQDILNAVDGEFIARINFTDENSATNSELNSSQVFLIRYSEKNYSLLLASPVSEVELWYIVKYLE